MNTCVDHVRSDHQFGISPFYIPIGTDFIILSLLLICGLSEALRIVNAFFRFLCHGY